MLNAVKSWGYQLQNIRPAKIAASPYDLVVIDYANDDRPFTAAEITAMQRRPDGGRRLIVAYLSIGEAETYRSYWNKDWKKQPPSWLGKENREWRGNYAVRFWDPQWQQIIFGYADRIVAAGFDGLYLDKVDEFELLGHKNEMVAFVAAISARVKAARKDFFVISQNGQALLEDARFCAAIDGFAREDLFYGEDDDGKRNEADSIQESVALLRGVRAAGKPVFVVEYPRGPQQTEQARREIAEHGFVGLTARRDLDSL